MNMSKNTAAKLYEEMVHIREPYLERAKDAAALTIPSLIPPNDTKGLDLPQPWQGIGARGVNNLASKILLALLPPNTPFFRLMIDDFTLEEMAGLEGGEEAKANIEKALAKVERAVMTEIDTSSDRIAVFEAIKHLLVSGNVLMNLQADGSARVFKLNQYVVKRSPRGHVLKIVVKELVSKMSLPEKALALLGDDGTPKVGEKKDDSEDTVDLYTVVEKNGDYCRVWQEIDDKVVPNSQGYHPIDKSPWLALRWARIDGEDYGRGHVEEYIGDLQSHDGLTESIVQGAAIAAKITMFVDPNSTTDPTKVAESENGDVIEGNAAEVSILQAGKFGDFRVALEATAKIEQRLAQAFLLASSIQRNAERVTAEEIRIMASELEDSLGGVYSILTQEFQLPYVRRKMNIMQKQGRLPSLPDDQVKPAIVTGLEALGRSRELTKMVQWARVGSEVLGDEFHARVHSGRMLSFLGTNIGFDAENLLKTDQELQQQQQAQQRAALMREAVPAAMRQQQQQN